jgi:hypothetical protein
MKRGLARPLALALVLLSLCTTAPAGAQDTVAPADSAAEARSQYQQGTQAFAQKRYPEAAVHFEAAAAYRVNAVTLYTAGLAWDLASRSERAADAFSRALEVQGLDAKQTQTARDRVAQLERSLGTLHVTGPEGTKVQLDQFSEAPVPARLHAGPGVHTLSIRIPGKSIERRDVTLEIGRTLPYEVKEEVKPPKEEPPPPPPKVEPPPPRVEPPPQESFWTLRRVIGVGVGGVGIMAAGATAILGINANGAKDAYDAGPTREGFDHASSLQTWTNVMLISSVVLIAGGVVLVVLPDKNDGRVRVTGGLGSVFVGGTF